jgi:hypothetical protein
MTSRPRKGGNGGKDFTAPTNFSRFESRTIKLILLIFAPNVVWRANIALPSYCHRPAGNLRRSLFGEWFCVPRRSFDLVLNSDSFYLVE